MKLHEALPALDTTDFPDVALRLRDVMGHVVAEVPLPMPGDYDTVGDWLAAEGLANGVYKAHLTGVGRFGDPGFNAYLREIGCPQRGTIEVRSAQPPAAAAAPSPSPRSTPPTPTDAALKDNPDAANWTKKTAAARAQAAYLKAQRELQEEEAMTRRQASAQAAGFATPFEQQVLNRLESLAHQQPANAQNTPGADLVGMFVGLFGQLLEALLQRQQSPPQTTDTGDDIAKLKNLVSLAKDLTREHQEPETEWGGLVAGFRDYVRLVREHRESQGPPPGHHAPFPPPGHPPPFPPSAQALPTQPPPPSPQEAPPPAAPAAEPAQQRATALLDAILIELRNNTKPDDAADALCDSDAYALAPGPLRNALDSGDVAGVLNQFRQLLPESKWSEAFTLLTTEPDGERHQAWLRQLLESIAQGWPDTEARSPEPATPTDGENRLGTADGPA